jgi:hypothetical protein
MVLEGWCDVESCDFVALVVLNSEGCGAMSILIRCAILHGVKELVKVALYLKVLDVSFEFAQLDCSCLCAQRLIFLPLYWSCPN